MTSESKFSVFDFELSVPELNPSIKAEEPEKVNRGKRHVYTEAEKRDVILQRIWLGSVAAAARVTGVSRNTISGWIEEDPARYDELLETNKALLSKFAANRLSEQVMQLLGATDEFIKMMARDLSLIAPADRPNALNKMVISMGILLDKARLLDDRPTSIVQHRGAAQIIEDLNNLVDSDAEEVTDAEANQLNAGTS